MANIQKEKSELPSATIVIPTYKRTNLTLIVYFLLYIIVLFGFFFRYRGIEKNLSYWNDESNVAIYSRGIINHGKPINEYKKGVGLYQIGLFYVTATSFKLFGENEMAGRLPSVITGTLLIILIFVITKQLTNNISALIATFLMSFSQIQLAWSTQLRPYIWLELFTLITLYFLYKFVHDKKFAVHYLLLGFLSSTLGTLFHGTGLINFILLAFVVVYKSFLSKKIKSLFFLIPLTTLFFVYLFSFKSQFIPLLFNFNFDFLHYRIYLTHNYLWLIFGTMVGLFLLFYQNKKLTILLFIFSYFYLLIIVLKIESNYVRYSFPMFPALYILFSIALTSLMQKIFMFNKSKDLVFIFLSSIILLFFAFPIVKNKILFMPRYYYSINADMRENPIVDYKLAFIKIKNLLNKRSNYIIMDAWNDRVPFYLPKQDFLFLTNQYPTKIDPNFGEIIIGNIKDFEAEKKKYNVGIVIVENWESLTPKILQEHIRKTLQHEFDVNNLPYNEDDKWSISIYSWGIKSKNLN